MCGRFTLRQPEALPERFQARWEPAGELVPRYNIAPSQPVAIVTADHEGRHVRLARWGLIPGWAKDAAIGNKMINARAETLDEKPSFRSALRARRCLVPADGFFEWWTPPDQVGARRPVRQPLFFHQPGDGLFAFAGLYEHWHDPASGELVTSCTIISTHANRLMEPYHHRIAAIMPREQEAEWLAADAYTSGRWRHLLEPCPDDQLTFYPISTMVNDPRHDGAEIIARVA